MKFDFKGKIKSYEILSKEKFSVLTKQGDLITENSFGTIKYKFKFPLLRRIDDDTFLIAETRCKEFEKNAKVFNRDGALLWEFAAGDAISNIVVFNRKYVFSYFDEGVMGEKNISNEGLVVFNKKGKPLYSFNSRNKGKYRIWDCYQMIKTEVDKILFYGYGKLPILEMDINQYSISELDIPIDIFVDSISSFKNEIIWKKSNKLWIWNKLTKINTELILSEKKDRRFLIGNHLVQLNKDGFEFEIIPKGIK